MTGINDIKDYIRPGYFSVHVKTDDRRMEFDNKNQVITQNEIPVDLLFIGDSIIQMWELAAYLAFGDMVILNRGIGGDRTGYLKQRFAADALQLQPENCVLMIGINDTWELEDDYLRQIRGSSLQQVLGQAVDNTKSIFHDAKQRQIHMYACSLLPESLRDVNHQEDRRQYIKVFNQKLQRMCLQHGFAYLDFYSALAAGDGVSIRQELTNDGLHPNVFGYGIMTDILIREFNSKNEADKQLRRREYGQNI